MKKPGGGIAGDAMQTGKREALSETQLGACRNEAISKQALNMASVILTR